MPPSLKVELVKHNPDWAIEALAKSQALHCVLKENLRVVHHIGSTSIPSLSAKPILDLLPVVANLQALDDAQGDLEALGYRWWGQYGLFGRRYLTKYSPDTGRRLVQLHIFAEGSTHIARHLAFRDYLRQHPASAKAYEREKERCRAIHPNDSHAYTDCKSGWIERLEAEALAAGSPIRRA